MRPQLSDDDVAQYQGIQDRLRRLEQQRSLPIGAIVLWRSGVAVPDGWLECNGSTFSGTVYPELAALWATTTLPADPGISSYIVIVRAS